MIKINLQKYALLLLLLVVAGQQLPAQGAEPQSTKIGAVIGVIVIIFALIVLYMVRLERKINKLEKEKKT